VNQIWRKAMLRGLKKSVMDLHDNGMDEGNAAD